MKPKKMTKHTLLKGEGVNQHTLYGEFTIEQETDFAKLTLTKDSVLRHEQPNGSFAEHKALSIDKGKWVMGKQVEYNPFDRTINRVWD
jgi:ribosomal 30S subunit maturation factor RimM